MKALIVVDVQNDFCSGGALSVPEGDSVVPFINSVMADYPIVVATRDWHPKGHCSFSSSHRETSPGDEVTIGALKQRLWPDHCIYGTAGANFHPLLEQNRFNAIINKGMKRELDSYSAFFENDKESPTGLEGYLRTLNVNQVDLCGLALDFCVYFSAVDSHRCGFRTSILSSGCRLVDLSPGSWEAKVEKLERLGISLL